MKYSDSFSFFHSDKKVMDVDEATAFIRYSLLDNHVQQPCNKNGSCSKVDSRSRRSIDLDYSGGLDVVFLVDGSNGVSKDDYKIGLKFAQELIRVLAATILWVLRLRIRREEKQSESTNLRNLLLSFYFRHQTNPKAACTPGC